MSTYAKQAGIREIVVHAPYIINLANTVKPETFELAVQFLEKEIRRTAAMRSHILVLHPYPRWMRVQRPELHRLSAG